VRLFIAALRAVLAQRVFTFFERSTASRARFTFLFEKRPALSSYARQESGVETPHSKLLYYVYCFRMIEY
jgi:hypothetical protein